MDAGDKTHVVIRKRYVLCEIRKRKKVLSM